MSGCIEGMLRVAGYTSRPLHHRSEPGLRTSPQEPLQPDPARSPDARHGRIPGDGRSEGNRSRRLPAGPGHHRAAGPQTARARSRSQGFRQQTVRFGGAAGARPQHSGSASVAPANRRTTAKRWKRPCGSWKPAAKSFASRLWRSRRKASRNWPWRRKLRKACCPACLPQFENFRIHAFNKPTRYVGGDFYDFLQLSSGEWMGVLADVSGKGMSAALLSSMVLGALSMEFRSGTATAGSLEPDEPASVREISSLPVRHAVSLPAEPGRRGTIHQRGT